MLHSFPLSLQAGFWGLVAGSALLIGAMTAYLFDVPQRVIATIMAFGSGVLISALSFELMDDAFKKGGFDSTAIGFVGGALLFTAANIILSKRGAKHRKRSNDMQPSEKDQEGSGAAIALGALLDGIPESIVIGLSLVSGAKVSLTAVVAIFLSNVPEGLSSAAGMKKAGRSALYIFGLWSGITAILGIASLTGYSLFAGFSPEIVAATTAFAAGSMLAMISDTMMPEAFEIAHDYVGLITVLGFLAAFILSKISG